MKRSQINAVIRDTIEFAGRLGFQLPPFNRQRI